MWQSDQFKYKRQIAPYYRFRGLRFKSRSGLLDFSHPVTHSFKCIAHSKVLSWCKTKQYKLFKLPLVRKSYHTWSYIFLHFSRTVESNILCASIKYRFINVYLSLWIHNSKMKWNLNEITCIFFYSFKFYPIWYRMHFYLNWAIITQMVYWYQFFNLSIANLFLYMIKDIPNFNLLYYLQDNLYIYFLFYCQFDSS